MKHGLFQEAHMCGYTLLFEIHNYHPIHLIKTSLEALISPGRPIDSLFLYQNSDVHESSK